MLKLELFPVAANTSATGRLSGLLGLSWADLRAACTWA